MFFVVAEDKERRNAVMRKGEFVHVIKRNADSIA